MKEYLTLKNLIIFTGFSAIYTLISQKYKKRKRKIFVSYHYSKDSNYKNTLKMWAKNENIDFDFNDASVDIGIKSENESVIKQVISRKTNESDLVISLIGEETHLRPFVNWELEKAKELNKTIIAVKIKNNYKAPKCLLNSDIKFIKFTQKFIFEAINKS